MRPMLLMLMACLLLPAATVDAGLFRRCKPCYSKPCYAKPACKPCKPYRHVVCKPGQPCRPGDSHVSSPQGDAGLAELSVTVKQLKIENDKLKARIVELEASK